VAVIPADLLAPTGPVEVTLFRGEGDGSPGTTLHDRLETYIGRATDEVEGIAFPRPEAAIRLYSLYLTFESAYLLACSRPTSENLQVEVLGSYGYTKDQRDALRARADEYLGLYEQMKNTIPGGVPYGVQTRQVTNVFRW
jgi:hypothetical protein